MLQMELAYGEQLIFEMENPEGKIISQDTLIRSRSISESESENFQGMDCTEEPVPKVDTKFDSASDILDCVKDAIREGKNLLIECPPGLDRRMTILQGALEFYQSRKSLTSDDFQGNLFGTSAPSGIYLGVPSFTEIGKVLQEMNNYFKSKNIFNEIRVALLGPCEKLCTSVNEETTQEGSGLELFKNRHWNIRQGLQQQNEDGIERFSESVASKEQFPSFTEDHSMFGGGLHDLTDSSRHDCEGCACYDSSYMQNKDKPDLVICPMEYILSPALRCDYDVKLKNSIIIMDDGYDIETRSFEEGSVKITSYELKKASSTLQRLISEYQRISDAKNIVVPRGAFQQLAGLAEPLRNVSDYIWASVENDLRPQKEEILEHLSELNVGRPMELCTTLNQLLKQPGITIQNWDIIEKMKRFIFVLNIVQNTPAEYSIGIEGAVHDKNEAEPTLLLLCGNTAVLFRDLENTALSLILGGSCLAPINCLINSIDVKFHKVLHVVHEPSRVDVAKNRYILGYCSRGPTDTELALDFNFRGKPEIQLEVCRSILELCKVIPNGVVVLIHSLRYAKQLWKTLKGPTNIDGEEPILTQIESMKHVINLIQPLNGSENEKLRKYKEFCNGSDSRTGAVLFTLTRGSVWQKLYLKGKEIRGIVHVGTPFRSHFGEYTLGAILDYLITHASATKADPEETFREWNGSEAFRYLNQLFARSVQSDNDWGMVIVLDTWMHARRHEFGNRFLPSWVYNLNLFKHYKFNTLTKDIEQFTKQHLNDQQN